MTVYVCLDDQNGMLFNKRRQSRDTAVLEDIRSGLPGQLTIDPFSEKLIQNTGIPYFLSPEDGAVPAPDAHFFLECRDPAPLIPLADTIVIYRWNRHYPADTRWDIDLVSTGFRLSQTTEFAGKSHETITKEVYSR